MGGQAGGQSQLVAINGTILLILFFFLSLLLPFIVNLSAAHSNHTPEPQTPRDEQRYILYSEIGISCCFTSTPTLSQLPYKALEHPPSARPVYCIAFSPQP